MLPVNQSWWSKLTQEECDEKEATETVSLVINYRICQFGWVTPDLLPEGVKKFQGKFSAHFKAGLDSAQSSVTVGGGKLASNATLYKTILCSTEEQMDEHVLNAQVYSL